MGFSEFEPGKFLIIRPDHDADLIEYITEVAKEEGVEAGAFTAMGALKEAKLAFYNQESHEYQEMKIDDRCEIASCTGNISILDGEPFAHTHAVLADEEGNTVGGHLEEGKVFASEVHLQVLEGPELERTHDEITDLSLWDLE